jgi:regulator of protease activity HflC (stomatin/prohibitin superfamily)
MLLGILLGILLWFFFKYGYNLLFTVDQNERAIKTVFGKAKRLNQDMEPILQDQLSPEERLRYKYPTLEVIPPGGPYIKWPWEKVYKVSIATQNVNMAFDPDAPEANNGGRYLEAVTKDQLNTNVIGQIRYRISERNLYAYIFGIKNPLSHVMGYLVSLLRERISNFEAPTEHLESSPSQEKDYGVSINDLRKNLRRLNEVMMKECKSSEARYGVILDASLITAIDPPSEVEAAMAAINTAHNEVSSDISLARAHADQTIVQSKRAVEIETLKAEAEAEPLKQLAAQLLLLKKSGQSALPIYRRNIRMNLFKNAKRIYREVKND